MEKNKKTKSVKEKKNPFSRPKGAVLEAMFTSTGDHIMAVVVVDKDGKITHVNKGFEALTQWKKEEVIGKSLVKIIPREDENKKTVPFKQRILSKVLAGTILTTTTTTTAAAASVAASIEKLPTFYYVRKDKSRFPVTSVISPAVVKDKIVGAVEVFYDITKEKELERIRMDFLSLASHQLRTPLTGTKWLIENIHEGVVGKLTKKQRKYIDNVYKINEQMIKLVADILDTLRLESEEAILRKEKISVPLLFKDVLTIITAAARRKKLILRSPSNHRTLTIETDPEILKAILGCFLANAIDYSMPGKKVILDVKEEPKTVVFSVRDFGIGIPQSEQSRMFERFYRASNAKEFKSSGSGLGLNIARTLAEKIGAEIAFKSEENKGSIFYLTVPRRSSKGAKLVK